MPLDHIIPALAKIAFYVSYCRPFDQGMDIVPGVWAALLFVVAMQGIIPTVEIATWFNEWINATDEGMRAIHHRHFLMHRLYRMMQHVKGAVIEDAGYTDLCELFTHSLKISMGKQLSTRPEQDVDLDPFADGIAQHRLNSELMCTPEVDLGFLKSLCPQLGQECLLFWAAILILYDGLIRVPVSNEATSPSPQGKYRCVP